MNPGRLHLTTPAADRRSAELLDTIKNIVAPGYGRTHEDAVKDGFRIANQTGSIRYVVWDHFMQGGGGWTVCALQDLLNPGPFADLDRSKGVTVCRPAREVAA